MSNIFGPAGPFMHPDQIFCYSTIKRSNESRLGIIVTFVAHIMFLICKNEFRSVSNDYHVRNNEL